MTHSQPEGPGPADSVDVSIVIPAHNEELAVADEIRAVHGAMRSSGWRYEIVVVDDGSTDATAERAGAEECRLLRLPRNRGYGAALKHGIEHARSDLIVITDADATYPAEEIPRLLAASHDHDMVVGSRTGKNVSHSKARAPAKWFLRMLASYLSGTPIPDLNSGLRVIRRRHVRTYARILPAGFSFTTTITLALLCTDRSVLFVPVDYHVRKGQSKIRPKHAYLFLILILRVIVLFNPLKIFLPLGAFSFAVGAAKFAYDLTLANLSESAVMGLLGGVMIWSVGLLADQNARLNLERWDDPGTGST